MEAFVLQTDGVIVTTHTQGQVANGYWTNRSMIHDGPFVETKYGCLEADEWQFALLATPAIND